MKVSNKGFTLIEMLAALAVSAIIITGLYGMLTSVLNTREAAQKKNSENALLMNFRKLVKADMAQLYKDTLTIDGSGENSKITFRTSNSIKLEKAVPVDVTYYVDDGWLIRSETSDELQYEWELRLLPDTEDLLALSHNGYRFTEEYDKSDTIIQISFRHAGHTFKMTSGCAMTSEGVSE
ncbi:MAG: type II secretion system protein J [Deferribacterales bacterium]